MFPENFEKFLRTPFLRNTSEWLLLKQSSHFIKQFDYEFKNIQDLWAFCSDERKDWLTDMNFELLKNFSININIRGVIAEP